MQYPEADVTNGNTLENAVVNAVKVPDLTNSSEVLPGTTIQAVYVEMWLTSTATNTVSQQILTVEKVQNNNVGATQADMLNLYNYDNKRNVLYTTQGIIGNESDANPIAVIRQWIPIPKGKQRFALGDRLLINISNVSTTASEITRCGLAIYIAKD